MFFHVGSQSRPISMDSFQSGALARIAAISAAIKKDIRYIKTEILNNTCIPSLDCVTRSLPFATYPRLLRGSTRTKQASHH